MPSDEAPEQSPVVRQKSAVVFGTGPASAATAAGGRQLLVTVEEQAGA